jgi:hypothetical protein
VATHRVQRLQRTKAGDALELGPMGKIRGCGALNHDSVRHWSGMSPHLVMVQLRSTASSGRAASSGVRWRMEREKRWLAGEG